MERVEAGRDGWRRVEKYQEWWEGSCGAGGRGSSGGRVEEGYREVRGVGEHGGIGILLFARGKTYSQRHVYM